MKSKAIVRLWMVFFLLLGLAGCAKEPIHQQQGYVFGTLVEVTIYGQEEARARELAGQVFRDFDRLHGMLHAWKPGTLSDMNAVFARSPARAAIPPELAPIIRHAALLSETSGGLFNPAIGKLVSLWGFHRDEFSPLRPDPQAIAALVKADPKMTDIVIDGSEFYSTKPAVQVDLGGYAKGYALDLATAYLRSQGVKNALINIGGNIMALGSRGDRPWQVGIQHPRKPGPIATLNLRDGEAIGTSGDYQRYFILDGKRYCHIIDPRTGYPVQGTQAATVLTAGGAQPGTLSDVASKPIFIAGVPGWRAAAKAMGVQNVMLIDARGEVHVTRSLRERLRFLDKGLTVHEVP